MTKGVDTTMLTEKMLRYFRVELVSRQRLFTTHQAESFGLRIGKKRPLLHTN